MLPLVHPGTKVTVQEWSRTNEQLKYIKTFLVKQQRFMVHNSEIEGPEAHHRLRYQRASDGGNEQKREIINWPSSKQQQWNMLEEDLVKILETLLQER